MPRDRSKLKPREARFLQNAAKGMTQGEAYLAAGYKCKEKRTASNCGGRLLARLNRTMPAKEMINLMIPTEDLVSTVVKILETSEDKTRISAAKLAGLWKGLEDRDQGGLEGAQIIIVGAPNNPDSDPNIIGGKKNQMINEPPKRKQIRE